MPAPTTSADISTPGTLSKDNVIQTWRSPLSRRFLPPSNRINADPTVRINWLTKEPLVSWISLSPGPSSIPTAMNTATSGNFSQEAIFPEIIPTLRTNRTKIKK
ncbi:hypothetical protein HMSSN139_11770 [Paenibacillus sp. HMSSN-139]|nr:hypothetical protein HMSSN139_11770 [Paenibacillus sp. HMSSN-139]